MVRNYHYLIFGIHVHGQVKFKILRLYFLKKIFLINIHFVFDRCWNLAVFMENKAGSLGVKIVPDRRLSNYQLRRSKSLFPWLPWRSSFWRGLVHGSRGTVAFHGGLACWNGGGAGKIGMAQTSDTPNERFTENFAALFLSWGGLGLLLEPTLCKAGVRGLEAGPLLGPLGRAIWVMARAWTSRFWTSVRPMETCSKHILNVHPCSRNVPERSVQVANLV